MASAMLRSSSVAVRRLFLLSRATYSSFSAFPRDPARCVLSPHLSFESSYVKRIALLSIRSQWHGGARSRQPPRPLPDGGFTLFNKGTAQALLPSPDIQMVSVLKGLDIAGIYEGSSCDDELGQTKAYHRDIFYKKNALTR